jgi:two-component system, NarL family, response regulator NreC
MTKIRILLVDDHAVVREGIKRLIDSHPDIELVGEAADGTEAVTAVDQLRPDVVMMDVSMPRLNGIDTTRQLRDAAPESKILALTVHEDDGYVREFLKAGALGYLLKRASTEELIRAIRIVAGGGVYVDPRVAETLVRTLVQPANVPPSPAAELSERECEVMRLIALGYANKEIASQLDLSIKTIETYKARSMEKLGLRSRVDIVRLATERGWFAPPPARK